MRFISISPRVWNRNIILVYHRVLSEPPQGFCETSLYLNYATLDMHLKQLSKYYELIPLQTLIKSKKQRRGLCSITFDDGWIDTYDIAFPILRKNRVPATVFVPTGLIGKGYGYWFEDLNYLANESVQEKATLFIQIFSHLFPSWRCTELSNESLSALISCMKHLPSNDLIKIVNSAYEKLNIQRSPKKVIINWEQIREMSQHDISFGPHGSRHYILPTVSTYLKKEEIFKPLFEMEEMGIKGLPIFSYPNGDWDDESACLLYQAGYEAAVSNRLGYVNEHTDMSIFALNRVDMCEANSNTPSLFWFRLFQAILQRSERLQALV